MIGRYQVVYKNQSGEVVLVWRDTDFISLEYARSVNNAGAMSLIIYDDGYERSLFQRDFRAEIWRSVDGAPGYLETNTFWLLRSATKIWDEQYRVSWLLQFEDTTAIIGRRIVAYKRETSYADKTIEELGAMNTDLYADNMMKAYMSDNFGTTATDATRDLSAILTIETKVTAGPLTEKQAAFRSVLSVLQEIATDSESLGTNLYFDMIGDEDGLLRFITRINYLGVDHSADALTPVLFGPQFSNLSGINLMFDYSDEKDVAYVGGADNGAARVLQTVTDDYRISLSPYNRLEMFHDCRDWDDTSVLDEEGEMKLQQATPKARLNANALDTPTTVYGRDYQYGDLVTAIVDDYQIDCHITAIHVRVAGEKEEIQAVLKGDTDL